MPSCRTKVEQGRCHRKWPQMVNHDIHTPPSVFKLVFKLAFKLVFKLVFSCGVFKLVIDIGVLDDFTRIALTYSRVYI